jgi:hypothetical protein
MIAAVRHPSVADVCDEVIALDRPLDALASDDAIDA